MHVSKEVRIGLLAVISLVIFFVGFYFLKGASLFSNDQEYYSYYTNIDGLQNSANVQIRGLNVGRVAGMKLEPGKGVKVTISINKNVIVPVGSAAFLQSSDLLGTKMIRLDLGPGPGTIPPGSELKGEVEGGIVDNVSGELTPRLKEMKAVISAFDTTLVAVNAVVGAENQKEISEALHAIKVTAVNLSRLSESLMNESDEIHSILHSANSITSNLAKSNDTINRIMSNMSRASAQMSNAPIQKTVEELHATVAQMKGIAEKINSNQGSLGMMINNKELYNNLNNAARSLDSLERDLKARPGRYINVSVFGKSKK